MAVRRRKRIEAFDVVLFAVLTLFALLILIPVYLVFVTSFMPHSLYIQNPVQFFPKALTLTNYTYIVENCSLLSSYLNSIVNTALSVCYGLVCTVCMGYALSFKDVPGRRFVFVYMVITMFFGGGLLPDYLLAKNLGLINTRWAVILWGGIGASNVIIIRNNIESLPVELREAAYIDGAGEATTFTRVILPLLRPTIATFTLFFAVAAWNDYFWPMLMLQSNSLRTLPLMLRSLITNDSLDTTKYNASITEELRVFSEGIKMAGVVMTMLPIMCVYPFLQKHFAKGMLVGSVKL